MLVYQRVMMMIFPRYSDCITAKNQGWAPHPRLECELIASRMRHVRRLFRESGKALGNRGLKN